MNKPMRLLSSLTVLLIISTASFSQSDCTGNVLTNSNGYYGGFESGGSSISATSAGSDLYNGLPRNGSYQIVQNISQLGGGGYLPIKPRTGSYFLAAHTSNTESDRIWYANVKVQPGMTYNFCTYVTLLKNLGGGANFIVGLYINGTEITTGRVNFNWTSLCGTYTVPQGVTNVELSIRDPKKGLFFLALDDICFSPLTKPSDRGINPNTTLKDLDSRINVYPNPSLKNINLNIVSVNNCSTNVFIIDQCGRVVLSKKITLTKGSNLINLNDNITIIPGAYFVQSIVDGRILTSRFIVRN